MGPVPRAHHPPKLHCQNWQPLLLSFLGLFSSSPSWVLCFPKQAQRMVLKLCWGQEEQGMQVEMIIYSFTFSPLFQIDYWLCLQSTIYSRNQTRGGLIQMWIKLQVSISVVLTFAVSWWTVRYQKKVPEIIAANVNVLSPGHVLKHCQCCWDCLRGRSRAGFYQYS